MTTGPVRLSLQGLIALILIDIIFPAVNRLTSSIHAIYRPLARFRKGEASSSSHRAARRPDLPSVSDNDEGQRSDDVPPSDEDTEGDFESREGESITGPSHSGRLSPETIPDLDSSVPDVHAGTRGTSRSGSMATVRQNRRAQLAEKLREKGLDQGDEPRVKGKGKGKVIA